jgi:tetratricopeptide (TPR) repeat protein
MKLFILTAASLAALAAATGASAQTYKAEAAGVPSAVKVSEKAKPAIVELQKAVAANDRAKIPGALAAAQAAAQTSDDRWLIAGLQMKAALAVKDFSSMGAALDAIVAAGHIAPAKAADAYKTVGIEQYNAKDYAGAASQFGKAVKLQPNDTEGLKLLGQALLFGGNQAQALAVAQKLIAADRAAGRKVDESYYRLAVQAAANAGSAQLPDLAKQWLAAYPSPDSWRNTLTIYRGSAQLDDQGQLALQRLMSATGSLKTAADYNAYIQGLLLLSNFNEAHAVLDQAIAAKAIDPSSADAVAVNAKPKASAADLAAAAKTAPSGTSLFKIADRYYGLGDYAQAAELYRQAKAKGVDAATADLYTGIALARAGDKAGAKASLSAVSGPRAGIAQYWLLYLDQHP